MVRPSSRMTASGRPFGSSATRVVSRWISIYSTLSTLRRHFPEGRHARFLCPLTVRGFEIWKNGPFPIDSVPMQESDNGNAVPVWFVKVANFQAAAADDQVTIAEILAMSSLRGGTAHTFESVDHFGAYRPQG